MALPPPSLKGKALQLLSQREHSRTELASKLQRHLLRQAQRQAQRQTQLQAGKEADTPSANSARRSGSGSGSGSESRSAQGKTREQAAQARSQTQADISCALDELRAAGFQSDERTAEALVHAQSRRCGNLMLKRKLAAKGLSHELIEQSLAPVEGTELQRASELWQRRYGQAPQNTSDYNRQVRFLLARGFGSDVVRRLVLFPKRPGHGQNSDDEHDFPAELPDDS